MTCNSLLSSSSMITQQPQSSRAPRIVDSILFSNCSCVKERSSGAGYWPSGVCSQRLQITSTREAGVITSPLPPPSVHSCVLAGVNSCWQLPAIWWRHARWLPVAVRVGGGLGHLNFFLLQARLESTPLNSETVQLGQLSLVHCLVSGLPVARWDCSSDSASRATCMGGRRERGTLSLWEMGLGHISALGKKWGIKRKRPCHLSVSCECLMDVCFQDKIYFHDFRFSLICVS